MQRTVALWIWCFAVWLILTWTITLEQELFGAGIALAAALALRGLGGVVRPWAILDPRRLAAAVALAATGLVRIFEANVKLAYRIWAPSRPLEPGMVVVPTRESSDAGLTAVGLITSLIVDNQIVDVDRERCELQYHAVAVPHGGAEEKRRVINGPVERYLGPLTGGER